MHSTRAGALSGIALASALFLTGCADGQDGEQDNAAQSSTAAPPTSSSPTSGSPTPTPSSTAPWPTAHDGTALDTCADRECGVELSGDTATIPLDGQGGAKQLDITIGPSAWWNGPAMGWNGPSVYWKVTGPVTSCKARSASNTMIHTPDSCSGVALTPGDMGQVPGMDITFLALDYKVPRVVIKLAHSTQS